MRDIVNDHYNQIFHTENVELILAHKFMQTLIKQTKKEVRAHIFTLNRRK